MQQLISLFDLPAPAVSCLPYGEGHINRTFLVTAADGSRYVLQRINDRIFRDVDGLMANILAVTDHLRRKDRDPRAVLQPVRARDGSAYVRREDGCWRVFRFVEGTVCLQQPRTDGDFRESAAAFGRFQQLLQDFPAHTLCPVIPNFHNTPDRFRQFLQVLEQDPAGRASEVRRETDFLLQRQEKAGTIETLLAEGSLPLRVTHNDTKLNNVLLDAVTGRAVCVIDLDTVMPGSVLYDFGDAIRFGASSAAEDEPDLSRVRFLPDRFAVYARSYLSACTGLTALERELLPLGAWTITLEQAVRFLTDYLDGDRYYATQRPGQNLDRCRTQLKLVSDMEASMEDLQKTVSAL